jgi:polyhydroxyalkanoate synthesis regulator phasin
MHQHTRSGFVGFVLGLGLAWGLGSAQPAGAPQGVALPADPVERGLALLHRGLFTEQSRLPLDADRSIEQMLEAQSAAIARLETRLALVAPAELNEVQRRMAELEASLEATRPADVSALGREVQDLRRNIADLDRRVEDVPRSDLSQLARTVQDLERRVDRQAQRSATSVEGELRSLQMSLRSVEDRVRSLERRIP